MRSRQLAHALVFALAGCAAQPRTLASDAVTIEPRPPLPPSDVRPWSLYSLRDILPRYLPVPGDALGLFFQPDSTSVTAIRGPAFDTLCGEQCERPYAPHDAGPRFFYVGADHRAVVIAWEALAASLRELDTRSAPDAGASVDAAVLRGIVAKHRLPRTLQAWVERQPDGSLAYADELPRAVELHGQGVPDAKFLGLGPIPLRAVVTSAAAHDSLGRPAGELTASDRAVGAALAHLDRRDGSRAPFPFEKLVVRAADHGWVVSVMLGPCDPRILHVFVDESGQVPVDDAFVAYQYGAPRDCPPNPRGRRPALLCSVPSRGETLAGILFSELIHDEAASAPAFERLAAELAAVAGPATLVARARSAAADEVRHAEAMTRIGSRFGAIATSVEVGDVGARTIEAIATENAVEGCVHEAFAAVVCELQARRATDGELAAAMAEIVEDEYAHVELAGDVADWLASQLTQDERARVDRAVVAALDELPRRAESTAARFAAIAGPFGLPSCAEARWLAEAFVACFVQRPGAGHALA